MFDFRAPLFLILLAVIPLLIFVQRRARPVGAISRSRGVSRKRVTFCLRGAALFCAILALANLHRTDKEQRLAVVFLVDTSESIPHSQHESMLEQINAAVEKLKSTDEFGIISFAKETSVLLEIRQKQDQFLESAAAVLLETLAEQTVGRDGTDILAALKRAIALLPDDAHRRIVLFSDGGHNAGETALKDYLPLLSASNVEILTIPLRSIKDAVRVVQLQMPAQVRKDQSFKMNAVIETDGSMPTLTATLYHEGVSIDEFEWTLPSGTHVLPFVMQPISEEGNHRYQLKLNVTDEIPENNQGYDVVTIREKPHVLYVAENLAHTTNLKTLLEENGFVVEVMSPAEMPTELVELQRSDVVILSNVSVEGLSMEQLQHIENYVHDLGHGLVVIGGERAYGPGGYTDTLLERVLPVEMTPRERKDVVATVFVLDTSGSMANYVETRQKIGLAIEGVRTGIRNLDAADVAGIIGFNTDVHVISALTPNHELLRDVVSRLKPTGGTTKMTDAIKQAYEMLKSSDAKRKHILLLSDGKSDGNASELLDLASQIKEARISMTAIAIGDANRQLLTQVAEISSGHTVFVENIQQLPTVLTEAVRETQRYIVQEPFQPVTVAPTEAVLQGIGVLPQLHGYVSTTEKETAQVLIRSHKEEPILAAWNFGLGKSIAWTSDVQTAWAKEWIPWQNFGKFWGQVVNWTLPAENGAADFDLRVSLHHGIAEVNLETSTSSQAAYKVHIAGPSGISDTVKMQQVTATRYTGTFQIQDSGSYIITAQRESDNHKRTEVLSLAYPIEYAEFKINTTLLKMVAKGTAGIYEPTATEIAAPAGSPIERQVSLAQALLVTVAILFVLEMILRRFSITSKSLTTFLERFRATSVGKQVDAQVTAPSKNNERVTANPVPPQQAETPMTRLLAAKKRVR